MISIGMKRKIVIVLSGISIILCTISCLGLLIGGWILQSTAGLEPDTVAVQIDAPPRVNVNEPFQIIVRVESTYPGMPQTIHSIDISDDYLQNIVLINADPAYSEQVSIPLVSFESFIFEQALSGTAVIQLTMQPQQTGRYTGEFDVCINAANVCKLLTIETIVGE
ncbi:MAG: hypothetical protein GY796_00440 [Chloroflexi bacterium]|nr:hypothetical protein [Chloroflexota bacterium]